MTPLLELREVVVRYGPHTVLDRFSLTLDRGEVLALVGPNGAGKSTALKVAAGLLKPVSGSALFQGRELSHWKRREFARACAVVPQSPTLPPLYTVRAAAALGRTPYLPFLGTESARDRAAVDRSLEIAGISALAERRTAELSGGERQRVALARALAQEPHCLLLDEPTANLDPRYQESTLAVLRQMAARDRVGAMVVLHDLSLAAHFADRVVLMADGRVVASGPPECVLRPELLSETYQTPLQTVRHPETGRPIVVHAARKGDGA